MAIRSSQFFTFDSVSSLSFNIWNVNVGTSGLLSEPFFANRSINEVKIKGKEKPYFSNIVGDPLSFTVSFAINQEWTSDQIRAIARWLFTDYYKPLQFSDNMDRIYYAVFIGNSDLLHTGASQGYINLNVRCSSPYTFSPLYETSTYNLSSNSAGGTTIQIDNRGDISTFPQVYFQKIGLGDAEIINLSNSGTSFKFTTAITDPTVAPVMSQVVNVGSTLPATTYYGRYTYAGISGETLVSPETTFTLSSGYSLVMTVPTLATNSQQVNLYIGTTSGTGKLQGTSVTTTYTQSVPLIVGATAPTANTSGLKNLENIYVDSEAELIQSDQPNTFRMSNFNNQYLELVYGMNNLLVKGNMILRMKYSYIYLSG